MYWSMVPQHEKYTQAHQRSADYVIEKKFLTKKQDRQSRTIYRYKIYKHPCPPGTHYVYGQVPHDDGDDGHKEGEYQNNKNRHRAKWKCLHVNCLVHVERQYQQTS